MRRSDTGDTEADSRIGAECPPCQYDSQSPGEKDDSNAGVCEKNDRRYIRPYRAIPILPRKIQVGMHIAL